MLVLSRKKNERIMLTGGIALSVVEIRGDRVALGFDAPPDVKIFREEILESGDLGILRLGDCGSGFGVGSGDEIPKSPNPQIP
jgi:carbon storage regulator